MKGYRFRFGMRGRKIVKREINWWNGVPFAYAWDKRGFVYAGQMVRR